jgi:DNA-binding PadR family transcriptional regulator
LYILKCLSEGKDAGYLVQRFDHDEQLVRIWINLLIELKLLAVNQVGEYAITNKGREYLQTYKPHW